MISTLRVKEHIPRNVLIKNDDKRFFCQICGGVLKKPIQTFRGNVACYQCYHEKLKR